jgi:hypothetical protein
LLKRLFVRSSFVHLHQDPATTPGDLIELIDRFVDGRLHYGLEWDDFISWEHTNPSVEAARQTIGAHERLLFSGSRQARDLYCAHVIEQRNRLAAVLGRPQRTWRVAATSGDGGLFSPRFAAIGQRRDRRLWLGFDPT